MKKKYTISKWYGWKFIFLYSLGSMQYSLPLEILTFRLNKRIETSRLWNFSVRVQSWSAKVESDPVLTCKIFENHQSDPVLIRPYKTMYFILSHEANRLILLPFPKFNKAVFILSSEAKALLKLFAIRWSQLVELVKWQGWCAWLSECWSLSHGLKHWTWTQNLNPKAKPIT